MPGYEFYRDGYRGSLGEEAFVALEAQGEAQLARYEWRYMVRWPTPESRDRALCAIVDELARTEWARTEGRVRQAAAGSVSTGYDVSGAARLLQDAEKRYYRAACRYGDIYRGLRQSVVGL